MFAKVFLVMCGVFTVLANPARQGLPVPGSTTPPYLATLTECENKQSDIYFLLDSSSSLMPRDFDKIRQFVISFVDKLDVGLNKTRVGLGIFADDFSNAFTLTEHHDKSGVVSAVGNVSYVGGSTYTGKGLQGMRTVGFRDDLIRKNATKIGVIVTDGRSRHRTKTIAEAAKLKDGGVSLFAIGVGRGVDDQELAIFASEPHNEFVRHVSSFDDLSALAPVLAHKACGIEPPLADNATCGRNGKTDIVFVYNAAAMSTASVLHVQNFTESVVQAFSMTSGNVRVGVISEGRQGGDIALSQYIRKKDFVQALKDQPKTKLSDLLKKARLQAYEPGSGGRPNAKKIAIIFVDDVNISQDALPEARIMTYNDVIVYVIGVGLQGDVTSAKQLATSDKDFSVYQTYDQLHSARDDFVAILCRYLKTKN